MLAIYRYECLSYCPTLLSRGMRHQVLDTIDSQQTRYSKQPSSLNYTPSPTQKNTLQAYCNRFFSQQRRKKLFLKGNTHKMGATITVMNEQISFTSIADSLRHFIVHPILVNQVAHSRGSNFGSDIKYDQGIWQQS